MATVIKDRVIPTMDTLVKYDNPVLVTIRPEKVQFLLIKQISSFSSLN